MRRGFRAVLLCVTLLLAFVPTAWVVAAADEAQALPPDSSGLARSLTGPQASTAGTQPALSAGGTYEFDALGRAIQTETTTYSYDSLDRITADGTNTFGYAGFEIDPVQVGDFNIARSPGALPVAAQQGAAAPTHLGRNSHGDIGYHTDATGTVSATRAYDPFGATLAETGTTNALGFQGDYTDAVTGDVWMGARWYQPGTSTFTSRDTVFGQLQTPISLNRHTYAFANPTGMWDPDGRQTRERGPDYAGVDCDQLGTRNRFDCFMANGNVAGARGRNANNLTKSTGVQVAKVALTTAATPFVTAIQAGSDLGNCAADRVFVDEGHGCGDTIQTRSRDTYNSLDTLITNPTQLAKDCEAAGAGCLGAAIGAVITPSNFAKFNIPRPRLNLSGARVRAGQVARSASDSVGNVRRAATAEFHRWEMPAQFNSGAPVPVRKTPKAPNTTRIGDDIVGTSHNTVRPTQDWIYPGTVDDYAARLRAGESVSPIEVQRLADGTEHILDGHHRYVASQLTGIPVPKTVASDVWDVGFDDWADVTYVGPR